MTNWLDKGPFGWLREGLLQPLVRGACIIAMTATCGAGAVAQSSLEEAVTLWLGGNDVHSLPMLAEMAKGGDVQAQLLLGRIETMDKGPSPYRASLLPEERRALFRKQTVIHRFGRGWIAVAADDNNALAALLMRSQLPVSDPGLIAQLWHMGEREATDHPTRVVALYGTEAQKTALVSGTNMLDDLRPYVAYLSGPSEPRGDGLAALRYITGLSAEEIPATDVDALAMARVLALGYGYGDIAPDNKWRSAVETWVMTAPSTRPIANLCNSECTDEAGRCGFAFLAMTGGYFETVRLDTPLETIIPQDQFLNSPRARVMALRRAALARLETSQDWLASKQEIAEMSSCAADLIANARQSYE